MATPLDKHPSADTVPPDTPDWEALQASPEFARLRKAVRGFAFPMTAAFLAWYLLYVLLADYAHDFMGTKVFGNVNLGFVLGLLQFITTFAIAILYSRYAGRKMDPLADELRAQIEGAGR
ncbi:DUF485 domain-containing protein [Nakamurella sp. A5-74]|uniref:DUF485 domain-containing protein n=1 Tax=Nakamurella sp. A5-74 TaxID=3158264 RepID=A0AAU8DLX7_9ACTN